MDPFDIDANATYAHDAFLILLISNPVPSAFEVLEGAWVQIGLDKFF